MTLAQQRIGSPSGATRPRRRLDGLSVLTVYLVLLCAIPSNLTITALGSIGRPSTLWALGALVWWCWYRIQLSNPIGTGPQPVRIALFCFLGVALLSYGSAMLRGLPGAEVSPADSGLVRLLSWAAVVLVAIDGIPTASSLRRMLERLTWLGAALATLGILQFLTKSSLIDWISIPGMSASSGLDYIDSRGGFVRAAATATHPLEYGVLLCICFPIAIILALEQRERGVFARWFPVCVITAASLMSVSRSALIGIAIAAVVVLPALARRARVGFLIGGVLAVLAIGLLVPGMLGTLRGLFTGIASDPSTESRTDSYGIAAELSSRFPLIGKGYGTLLSPYHIFDNQYLLLLIELGTIGLAAFVALLVAAIASASSARRRALTRLDGALSQALVASVVSGGLLMAFFDGLSFPISAGALFLAIGLCASARIRFTSGDAGDYPGLHG